MASKAFFMLFMFLFICQRHSISLRERMNGNAQSHPRVNPLKSRQGGGTNKVKRSEWQPAPREAAASAADSMTTLSPHSRSDRSHRWLALPSSHASLVTHAVV
jgi:hypothetical protein